ncbi:serine/threonine protein kinase [Streptomyces sp. NBC_00322]|uniref:serine/threonine-protein kinase n=1 Tax=Streptomyces sp. NBC_00322 TaxID=2975712 RepID=UPI002E292B3E|nr:serine/threonine-protein kinase [Streptomyces sp. NBC_00322]
MRPLRSDDPREVAGYRLLARIGEGGMGSVYLTRTRGNQPVALKVIRREYAQEGEFRRRFQQEVKAARNVQGHHVVPVVDHDTTGTQPWLATTYIPGLPLDEALTAYGPLPLPAALQLIGCAAEALRAVHASGVIHRDLKPSNILLGAEGPWVIDFGIARAADATQLTRSGGLIGTPQYMSPEHAIGQPLTPATDIFSLGLIAAVVATGRHPYGDGSAITLATQIANTEARPPDLTGYPEALRPVLERSLAADPASRPAPAELAELCEEAGGRQLRDFAGWLPEPVTAEIARREEASQQPPEPAATAAPHGYTPTYVPQPPHDAPTRTAAPAPVLGSAPAPAPARSRRAPLVIGATAMAVVVAAAATWALTSRGNEKSTEARNGAPQPTASATKQSPASTATAAGPESAYEVIFENKPFTIRAPTATYSQVDLDTPKVVPSGADVGATEMVYQEMEKFSYLEFETPTGTSSGTTPEECQSATGASVLPNKIPGKDLAETFPKGTVLCTVTKDGNLAMLEITDVVNRTALPDFVTELTLWKIP